MNTFPTEPTDAHLTDPFERRAWQDEQIDAEEERADFEDDDFGGEY